jgi:hypothetical protein
MRPLWRSVLLCGVLFLADPASAQPPLPPGSDWPLPPPLGYHGSMVPHPVRPSAYAIWQHMDFIPNQGGFRPRVLYTPNTAFYTINGMLYPFVVTHPTLISPWAPDTAGAGRR